MSWQTRSLGVLLVLSLCVFAGFKVHAILYPTYVQIAERQVNSLFYPTTDKIKDSTTQADVGRALKAIAQIPKDNTEDKSAAAALEFRIIDAVNQLAERTHRGSKGAKG